MERQFPSLLLGRAVEEFSRLPGIGSKTALRLVLYLLRQDDEFVSQFTEAVQRMKKEVKFCSRCHNISDDDASTVCVVENIQDVMAIEKTQQYRGLYHVLGGIISPMDGIGPADLTIDALVERVQREQVKEVIFALASTMEGDTTCFYISRKLAHTPATLSVISRGISVGDELEYTDEVTLGRSIINRIPYAH